MIWKKLTFKVVRADVSNCSLPETGWGSSSSVIRKTRFDAVLGALDEGLIYADGRIQYVADAPVSQNPVAARKDITHGNAFARQGRERIFQLARVLAKCFWYSKEIRKKRKIRGR
jgi:hypothetical protein